MKRIPILMAPLWCILAAGCSSDNVPPTDQDASVADAADGQDAGTVDSGIVPISCDPEFSESDACGGDIDGSWTYKTLCGPTPAQGPVLEACAEAVITSERLENGTGTLNVNGGVFALSVTGTGVLEVTIPSRCVPLNSCAVLTLGINAALTEALGQDASATCTTANATPGCDCELRAPVEVC